MNLKTIVNFLTLLIILIGGIFKIQHWEGASMMILIGILLLFVTVIFAIKDMSVEAVPGFLKILIGGTLIVHVLAITFKIQHWEGGAMLVIIAYVLTVLSAIILMLNKSEVRIPRQLVITLFLHLILVMNLLATNNLIKA